MSQIPERLLHLNDRSSLVLDPSWFWCLLLHLLAPVLCHLVPGCLVSWYLSYYPIPLHILPPQETCSHPPPSHQTMWHVWIILRTSHLAFFSVWKLSTLLGNNKIERVQIIILDCSGTECA